MKGAALKLYVVLDLCSRYVVGWYLSESESAAAETCVRRVWAGSRPMARERRLHPFC